MAYNSECVDDRSSDSLSQENNVKKQPNGHLIQSYLLDNESPGRQDTLDISRLSAIGPYHESDGTGMSMIVPAAAAFKEMQSAARKEGIPINPQNSTYRSYRRQEELWRGKYGETSCSMAPKPKSVACPGNSRHGWGRAVDIKELAGSTYAIPGNKIVSGDITKMDVYNWLANNAPRFGFYHPTWARNNWFEPWHWEYYGVDTNPAINGASQQYSYNDNVGFNRCPSNDSATNTGGTTNGDNNTGVNYDDFWMAVNDYLLGTGNGSLADLVKKPITEKDTNEKDSTNDDDMLTLVDPIHPKDDIVLSEENDDD